MVCKHAKTLNLFLITTEPNELCTKSKLFSFSLGKSHDAWMSRIYQAQSHTKSNTKRNENENNFVERERETKWNQTASGARLLHKQHPKRYKWGKTLFLCPNLDLLLSGESEIFEMQSLTWSNSSFKRMFNNWGTWWGFRSQLNFSSANIRLKIYEESFSLKCSTKYYWKNLTSSYVLSI